MYSNVCVLPLGQEHDAFERQRDHPGIKGIDIGGAHELPAHGQLLIGKRHPRVDLAERGDLIAILRQIERGARVFRRIKRLGRIEDAAELEKVGDETRLIAEIAAGRQCLRLGIAKGVLAEPVGPAVGFELGIAKERSLRPLLALGLELLLALIDVWLRSLQVLPLVERAFEALADRAVGLPRGRGQRIRGYNAVVIACLCKRGATRPNAGGDESKDKPGAQRPAAAQPWPPPHPIETRPLPGVIPPGTSLSS